MSDHLRRYLEIKNSGNNAVAKCPFHQDSSPSLYIYPHHYHCFACGAHGNVIDYEIHRTGLTFKEIIEQLSQSYQIALEYDKSDSSNPFEKRRHAFEEKNLIFQALQTHFKKNLQSMPLQLDLFSDAGFTSTQESLDEFINQFPENPITLSNKELCNRITFPLCKENGKIYGFALSQQIEPQSENWENIFNNLKIIAPHKFTSHYLNWSHARSFATKEKQLVVTLNIKDAFLFIKKGIQNSIVLIQEKMDLFTAKTLISKVQKVIFILPFSEKGKSFLQKTFQEIYPHFESNFFVHFIQDEDIHKLDFFSNNSSEKIKTWISLADKMVYKFTELTFEALPNSEKIFEFKSKILPFIHKIPKDETKRAILVDLAKKYFNNATIDIFYNQNWEIKNIPSADISKETKQKSNFNHDILLKDTISRAAEFYHKILLSSKGKEARDYLQKRGLTTERLIQWKIGLCPFENELVQKTKTNPELQKTLMELGLIRKAKYKDQFYDFFYNRIIIPIKSHDGSIIALSGRTFKKEDSQKQISKYINSPESNLFSKSHILFHFHDAMESISKHKYVFVVEGYMDCIALSNSGIKNVVAVMGTALTPFHVQSLAKLASRILLCFDNDKAGQNAAKRSFHASHSYPNIQLEYMSLPSGKDPDEFIQQFGGEKFLEVAQNQKVPLYEKICEWSSQESHDQQDLIQIFEKDIAPILNISNQAYIDEVASFVKLRYDIDIKKLAKSNSYQNSRAQSDFLQAQPAANMSSNLPDWSIQNILEIKFLFALVYLKLTELPARLINILQDRQSENENNEKICGLSLKSQLSQTSFHVLVELCSWMIAHPDKDLASSINEDNISHFSSASQVLLGYTTGNVKILFSFHLEEFVKDHLSSPASVITYKNLWSLNNSGFLKFHLHNIKLVLQNGILPSFFAETLLQLEVDYIDSILKTLSSFHFDNDVNEQFQYFILERIRRRVELKVL